MKINWKALTISLLLSLGLPLLLSIPATGGMQIYQGINKPPLSPPFGSSAWSGQFSIF